MVTASVTLNKNWWADFQMTPLVEPSDRLPVIPYRLGIIKQKTTPTDRTFDPQTQALMDNPIGVNKGHTYIVPLEWMNYMKRLMSDAAFRWWLYPDTMMVNRRHKYDGLEPPSDDECRFENISLPCNFIAFDQMTATHGRVVGRMNTHNTASLDPNKNNWYNEPHLFWKASMRNSEGDVRKVGSALDVYTPVIRQLPEQWANLGHIELFPPLPFFMEYEGIEEMVTGYCLQGASVYGHTLTRDIPLRLCRTSGELLHPIAWRLTTKPVPI